MSDPSAAETGRLRPVRIEHRLPGRMRLRVRDSRGDAAFFARVVRELHAVPGVRAVRANSMTGSLLIEHAGDEAPIFAAARERLLFEPAPDGRSGLVAAGIPRSPLRLAAAGLAGAGLVQLARGRAMGAASESFWHAYYSYTATRSAWPGIVLAGVGCLQMLRGEVFGSASSLLFYAWTVRRMAETKNAGDGANAPPLELRSGLVGSATRVR